MKIGSLVECIDDVFDNIVLQFHDKLPIKGKIYTIRGFINGVLLEEIKSKTNPWHNHEQQFRISRFREILPPISIEIEAIIEKVEC